MQVKRHAQRGQAMVEAAIFLPLTLFLLFGLIWAVQSGVQSERVQVAVRYSGFVSNLSSPYGGYSIYALYNQAASPSVSTGCSVPVGDALTNTGAFPGPASATFWSPIAGSASGTCTRGSTILSGGNLAGASVFLHTASAITANVPVPAALASALASTGNPTTITASQNVLETPDVGTLLKCYPVLQTTINASLTAAVQNAAVAPAALSDSVPSNPPSPGTC